MFAIEATQDVESPHQAADEVAVVAGHHQAPTHRLCERRRSIASALNGASALVFGFSGLGKLSSRTVNVPNSPLASISCVLVVEAGSATTLTLTATPSPASASTAATLTLLGQPRTESATLPSKIVVATVSASRSMWFATTCGAPARPRGGLVVRKRRRRKPPSAPARMPSMPA